MARTIRGIIRNSANRTPIKGALVKAYDEDVGEDDLMGSVTTDGNGNYSISYRGGWKTWDPSPSKRVTTWWPDIYIVVFMKNEAGNWIKVKTSRTFDDHRLKNDLKIDLNVTPPPSGARTIRGVIRDSITRKPIKDVLVRAYDDDPGPSDDFMGQATTNAKGEYKISYRGGHWDPAPHSIPKWRPDIYLRIFVKNVLGQYIQVKETQERSDHRLREPLVIDLSVHPRPYARTVKGKINWAGTNKPVIGAVVTAFDSDELSAAGVTVPGTAHKKQFMGKATSDNKGEYIIGYSEGHWDPAPHRITSWRPDIFIEVDLDGYVWISPVQDNVAHRQGCTIDMAVSPPLRIFPRHSGANRINLWAGWFGARAPENLKIEYREKGKKYKEVPMRGTWRVVGKAKRRRFFCNTFIVPVTHNKEYEVMAYVHKKENVVGYANFKSFPKSLSELSANETFNIFLGSCYYWEFDGNRVAHAYSKIKNSAYSPHMNMLCGDQVYLDAPWEAYVERHDTKTLYDLLTRRYRYSIEGSIGQIMTGAINFNTADDHEFWNNYPLPASYIPALQSIEYRRTWERIATELFRDIQGGRPTQIVHFGSDLSVFVADTRVKRGEPDGSGRFMTSLDMAKLQRWMKNLKGPGVLVMGQSIFQAERGFLGNITDWGLQDYKQYEELATAIWNSSHDIVVLTGDVHYGRVASCKLGGSGKKLVEVISSPMSCLPQSESKWDKDDGPDTFPHKKLKGIKDPAPISYHKVVSRKPNYDDRTAENFFTVCFKKRDNKKITMSVRAWLPRRQSRGALPYQDFEWSTDLA